MRYFDHSAAFRDLCYRAIRGVSHPVQAVWSAQDPDLTFDRCAFKIQRVAGLSAVHPVKACHFLQGERSTDIADRIAMLAQRSNTT